MQQKLQCLFGVLELRQNAAKPKFSSLLSSKFKQPSPQEARGTRNRGKPIEELFFLLKLFFGLRRSFNPIVAFTAVFGPIWTKLMPSASAFQVKILKNPFVYKISAGCRCPKPARV